MTGIDHHNRFYVRPEDVGGELFKIAGTELRHIKVKRLKPGDSLCGLDGAGRELLGKVQSITDNEVVCRITKSIIYQPPASKIFLGLGVIKTNPLSLACEKAAEMGVWEIIPLKTSRSIRFPGPQEIERLNRVTLSAMKQSGGYFLPPVREPMDLRELLEKFNGESEILFADFDGESILSIPIREDVLILVGPEGGFTSDEAGLMKSLSATPVSLGTYRLRSETAAMAAVSCLSLILSGDFS